MKKNIHNLVFSFLFFIIAFAYIYVYCLPFFKILEETQLFLFTQDFFIQNITKPAGLIYYVGQFIEQFYYFPILGVAIIAVLLTSLQITIQSIFKLRGFWYYLGFAPSAILLTAQFELAFQPELLIGLLSSLLLLFAFTRFIKFKHIHITTILLSILLYPLLSAYSVFALMLITIYSLIYETSKWRYLFAVSTIGVTFFTIFIYSYYVYGLYPLYLSFTGIRHGIFIDPESYRNINIIIALSTVVLLLVISRYVSHKLLNVNRVIIIASGAILTCGYVYYIIDAVNPQLYLLTNQLKTDRYAINGDWDGLLRSIKSTDEPVEQEMQDINLALCMKGMLGENLFNIPQTSGERGLYSNFNELSGPFGQKFSYHLGLYNMAYRWAYECISSYGNSPRFLKILLSVSVINEEYGIARKYATTLSNTLFYKDFALKYTNYIDGKGDDKTIKEIEEKRKTRPTLNTVLSETNNFGGMLHAYLTGNPDNIYAYNYFLAYSLLKLDLQSFINMLPLHYKEGTTLPRYYAEAVIMYNLSGPPQSMVKQYKISPELEKEYFKFMQQAAQNPSSLKAYEKTFWFYSMIYSSQQYQQQQ